MDKLAHLQPDFDPKSRKVTISDLQNILIDHGVPSARAKFKADYVALYEKHIRPHAPRLLKEAERVRASSVGIEDGRLPPSDRPKSKPKKPLVPPSRQSGLPASKSSSRLSAEPVENGGLAGSRKAASMHNLSAAASSKPIPSKGRSGRQNSLEPPRRLTRRSASAELEPDTDEDDAMEIDDSDERSKRRGSSSNRRVSKPVVSRPVVPTVIDEDSDEVDELMDEEEIEAPPPRKAAPAPSKSSGSTSPFRRPVVEIPVPVRRPSDIESPHKRKNLAAEDKPAPDSPFTSYNPFQSSPDEETKAKRRRKSSMGVKREHSPELSGMKRSKTVSSLAGPSVSQTTPDSLPQKSKASVDDGLERFRRKISGTSEGLPSPLRRHLSPPKSESKPRPSFASLAMAPEDFEVPAYTSPRKKEVKSQHQSPEKPKPAFVPQPVVRALEPENEPEYDEPEPEPVYQSDVQQISDSEEEEPVVVASSSAQAQQAPIANVVKHTSPKRAPAPPATKALVPARTGAVKVSKDIGRKSLQASGLATIALLLAMIWQSAVVWADGKRALGFCNTGEDINEATTRRQDQSELIRHRDMDLQRWQDYVDRARDFVAPLTCTPCPEQGVCDAGELIKCNQGYIEQRNVIASILAPEQKHLNPSTSIVHLVLPPRCVPDGAYLRRVLEIASESAKTLRRTKGDMYCNGHPSKRMREAKNLDINGDRDAFVFGIPLAQLKDAVQTHLNIDASEVDFETKFAEGLDYLTKHSEVARAVHNGQVWIAANAADMPFSCRARLAAYNVADEHKGLLSLISAVLAVLGYGRHSIKHRREIEEEVEELVPLSLSLLQAQAQNYSLRDSMTPEPFLAPAQLRDLVLRDEKSASRKAELWKKVEREVEKNANVRARVAEQHGEEIRVWQWVGGAYETDLPAIESTPSVQGAPASTNRRRSYAAFAPRPSLSRPGTPRVSLAGDRHMSWGENDSSLANEGRA